MSAAIDDLRAIVAALNYEREDLLTDIPTGSASYYGLWLAYDTEFFSGILDSIGEGADPAPALRWCRRHHLPAWWRTQLLAAQRKGAEVRP